VAGSDAEDNTVDNMAAKEIQLLIKEAVDHLPPKRQLIYKLSREQGLSHKEIADKLAISQHTVKNQLVVAIKSIQEYIRKTHGWLLPIIILLFR
jgi:RNA polymerase sigma-70 factor (ECF subfamily)